MRKQLSKSEIRELNEKVPVELSKKDRIEIQDELILVNGKRFFFDPDDPKPTLFLLLEQDVLKKITVDMGAVKFVANGADIMRPGIVNVEDGIVRGEIIVIIDEKNHKPLAIGKSLLSGEEIMNASDGKVVKNLHYVGDEIWNTKNT